MKYLTGLEGICGFAWLSYPVKNQPSSSSHILLEQTLTSCCGVLQGADIMVLQELYVFRCGMH